MNLHDYSAQLENSFYKLRDFDLKTAIILGSGLNQFGTDLPLLYSIDTADYDFMPVSTVEGHNSTIEVRSISDKPFLLFRGRFHFYEGYDILQCLTPVIIAKIANISNLMATNAAGGVNPYFKPSDLMIINSFNSFNIRKELSDALQDIKTVDTYLDYPAPELIEKLLETSSETGILLKEGLYWYNKGPAYETPAEIKMISKLGYDAVGMSTVHEIYFAALSGISSIAISCITNYAAGLTDQKLAHSEVVETADLIRTKFETLISSFILKTA